MDYGVVIVGIDDAKAIDWQATQKLRLQTEIRGDESGQ